jgi:hypothetical protein
VELVNAKLRIPRDSTHDKRIDSIMRWKRKTAALLRYNLTDIATFRFLGIYFFIYSDIARLWPGAAGK